MNEMIERIARALAALDGMTPGHFRDHDEEIAYYKRSGHRRRARAAIEAMRSPTEAMTSACEEAMGAEGAHDCEVPAVNIYQAGIDAALRD